ncbi:MAG TPA: hypothetical protein VKB87_18595 [Myxococcaceae bacterium]|nr:hypothetical protein [Myxococcaceae bacterium]
MRKHAVFDLGRSPERRDIARDRLAAVLDDISAHLDAPISLMDLAAVDRSIDRLIDRGSQRVSFRRTRFDGAWGCRRINTY